MQNRNNKRRNKETGYKKFMFLDESTRIINALKPSEDNYRLIFKIMKYMGLRVGDTTRLQYQNIIGDYEILRVHIEKSKIIANKYIPKKVRGELIYYVQKYKATNTNGYLFQPKANKGSTNEYLSTHSVRWRLYHLTNQLKLNDVYHIGKNGKKYRRISPHVFRRQSAQQIYDKSGGDIMLTKEFLNHKKVETTFRYLKTDGTRTRKIMDSMI